MRYGRRHIVIIQKYLATRTKFLANCEVYYYTIYLRRVCNVFESRVVVELLVENVGAFNVRTRF